MVIPIFKLKENSLNCSHTIGSLSFYAKDEANNFNANIKNTGAFKSSGAFKSNIKSSY